MVSRAKSNGFYDADAGASRYLLGRVSFQHMCEYFDSVMASDEDVPKSVKEAHRLMTIDRKYQLIISLHASRYASKPASWENENDMSDNNE